MSILEKIAINLITKLLKSKFISRLTNQISDKIIELLGINTLTNIQEHKHCPKQGCGRVITDGRDFCAECIEKHKGNR